MFNGLVDNAFDFLDQAISELPNKPKYSAINFYSAVELFIKARLMKEHWSLIVTKDPDWDKFIKGNFHSVTLRDANNRLSKIAQAGLTKNEYSAFDSIRTERNKVVHFYHEAHASQEEATIREQITKKQLRAWFYLHQLLAKRWKELFDSWSQKTEQIKFPGASPRAALDFLVPRKRGIWVSFDTLDRRKRRGIRPKQRNQICAD